MELLKPHEVEQAVARLLETNDIWVTEGHRGEALAYLIAARMPFPHGADDRLAVPDSIARFTAMKGDSDA